MYIIEFNYEPLTFHTPKGLGMLGKMDVTAIGQGGMTNDTDVTSGGGGLIGDNGTMTTTTTTNHESVYCGQGLDDFHTR